VLFDFQHSGNLGEIFLVLLDVVLTTFQSVVVAPKVVNANLQLVHFPGPVALKFSHIFLQLRGFCLRVREFLLCSRGCKVELFD
jgi:hypothetical protein